MSSFADLVVSGGKVFTAATGPEAWAAGFAVTDGIFVAVGGDLGDLVGPDTRVIELAGATVVPGLFDAHIHPFFGGKKLARPGLTLTPMASLEQILVEVDAWAATVPEGRWVVGGQWNATLSETLTAEARERLDAVSHGRAVYLADESGHNGWVNTRALEESGYALDGTDSPDGLVLDRTTGTPTGLLMERALDPARTAAMASAPDSVEDYKEYLLAAWGLMHSFGITGIQDAMTGIAELTAYAQLNEADQLPGWVSTCLSLEGIMSGPEFDPLALAAFADEHAGGRLRTNFTKLALDGVPTTRTAGMLCAYLPDQEHGHDYHGIVYRTAEELAEVLRGYRAQGRSTKIHCAGDWAVQVAIDAFQILRAEGSRLSYHIAHGQFVASEDRKRMSELDIVAEISPYIWYPGPIPHSIEATLPREVAHQMQPNRDLLDLGVLVAGGSDWSVVPTPNAWEGIAGLVTRADPLGTFPGTLWPEQAVTVEEAVRIFTINGAKAALLDDQIGSIEVGKAANFAVLDRDVFTVEPGLLGDTTVDATWLAGQLVYQRDR